MSDAPTLTIDGVPADWLGLCETCVEWGTPTAVPRCEGCPSAREWLAVDTLPDVTERHSGHRRPVPELGVTQSVIESTRPLRAGDAVTLVRRARAESVLSGAELNDGGYAVSVVHVSFATATVAEVLRIVPDRECAYVDPRDDGHVRKMYPSKTAWQIVDHAEQSDTRMLPLDALPNARPIGWAIRLTDVEAL